MNTPSLIIDRYGNQVWYLNGERHREDGPAVIYADGSQSWYLNGKYHRADGPAYIGADGSQDWYIDGKLYFNKKKFQEVANISDEDMTALLLKYNWK